MRPPSLKFEAGRPTVALFAIIAAAGRPSRNLFTILLLPILILNKYAKVAAGAATAGEALRVLS